MHLERVKARADAGGHSASAALLRRIHDASLGNLPRAVEEMDQLWIYDNSRFGGPLKLVMETKAGRIVFLGRSPTCLASASVRLGVIWSAGLSDSEPPRGDAAKKTAPIVHAFGSTIFGLVIMYTIGIARAHVVNNGSNPA